MVDDEQSAADDEQRTPDGELSTGRRRRAGESAADGRRPGRRPKPGRRTGRVRYTRRRVLILGGAFAAGLAAVIAGFKAFGGSAADKVGGAITDQFGPFPVRSVDPVPDVPPEKWVVKVDGLVDTPLTHRPRGVDRASSG